MRGRDLLIKLIVYIELIGFLNQETGPLHSEAALLKRLDYSGKRTVSTSHFAPCKMAFAVEPSNNDKP
jgi:hypothetical protein